MRQPIGNVSGSTSKAPRQNPAIIYGTKSRWSRFLKLSLFPLLILLSTALAYLPIPGLFDQVLGVMARFVPANSMGLINTIELDVATARGARHTDIWDCIHALDGFQWVCGDN